jgi:hypothetical protein
MRSSQTILTQRRSETWIGLGGEVLAQFGQHSDKRRRQRYGGRGFGQAREVAAVQPQFIRRRRPVAQAAGLEQGAEAAGADRRHRQAYQEAVEEGLGDFVLRHLVGGADGADQRAGLAPGAVVELAFVEQGQQGIEDRAVGLEYFVDECNRGIGQEALGVSLVAVVFEGLDRQRAEQFLGHREARQQPLEVAPRAEHRVQAPRQFALGRTRRADEQAVFAGQRGQQAEPHALAAFDEARFEDVEQGGQAGRESGIHEARL